MVNLFKSNQCHYSIISYGILQRRLGLYDFGFYAWPVDYNWDETKAEYVLL